MKRYVKAATDPEKLQKVSKLADEVTDFLSDNRISQVELWDYKIYEPIDRIAVVSIYINGDWKHDHLRADYLVKEKYHPVKTEKASLEDTGSDWGPELHTYYIYIPAWEEENS